MLYKRPQESGKFFEFLNLKRILIGVVVSVVGGFIIIKSYKYWPAFSFSYSYTPPKDLLFPSGRPLVTSNNLQILDFDGNFDDGFRKAPSEASIFNDLNDSDSDFFIFERSSIENRDPFWLLQFKNSSAKYEQLKDNFNDKIDRDDLSIEYDKSPKFTADGKSVVFCRKYVGSFTISLFLMNLDESGKGNVVKRITSVRNCFYSLTPDQKGVVYSKADAGIANQANIYRIDLDGTNETLLARPSQGASYSNPVLFTFLNQDGDDFEIVNRLFFNNSNNNVCHYLDIGTSERSEVQIFNVDERFLSNSFKLWPPLSDVSEPVFLATNTDSSAAYICNAQLLSCQGIGIGNNYYNNIKEIVLCKDEVIYYLMDRGYLDGKVLIKNNTQNNNSQDLVENFIGSSFSVRPKPATN